MLPITGLANQTNFPEDRKVKIEIVVGKGE